MTEIKSDVRPPVQEKPDWITNSLQGKLPETLGGLHDIGLTTNQFSIASADDYWGKESVKAAFTDENGDIHKNKFDEYYVKKSNEFRTNLQSEYLTYKNENQYSSEYARKMENTLKKPTVIAAMPDINGRSFNSNMPDGAKFGKPQFGIRENAINNYVKLPDGSTMSVENYMEANDNLFGGDFTKMLKFAKDKNGQYLTDENGRPYLVPVENGEKLRSNDEVYNGFNDVFNRYGVGNGFWSGVSASLIAIPKAGVNFFSTSIEALSVLGQVVSEPLAGKNSTLNRFFINTQNTMKGASITSTDKGLNDWTSYEGVIDMGLNVAFQLLGLVTGTGALRAIGTGTKTASRISRFGMSTMSGAPIYDVGKESGLSTAEASSLYAIGMAGFYGLAGADDILVNALMGKNAAVSTSMLKQVAQDALKLSVKGTTLTKGGLKAFRYNFSNGLRNVMQTASETRLGGVAGSTLLEAGQETSEQLWDTLLRLSFNQYSELRDAGLTDSKKGGKFIIDWDSEIESWKQAAVGGALGGAIAGGPMRRFMGNNNEPNDMLADFTRAIIDGKEADIYKMIDKMEAEDMFAEGFLTPDGNITGDASKSNNAEAAIIFKAQVKSLVDLRDSSAMQDFSANRISDMKSKLTGFDKLLAKVGIGSKENIKDAQTGILQTVGGIIDPKAETDTFYNSFTTAGRDAASLMLNIDALKAKKIQTQNLDEGSEIQEVIDKAEEKLLKLKNGEFTDEYLTQGVYNIRSLTNVNPLGMMSRAINGKSFVNLNNNYISQSKNVIAKYNTDLENQQNADSVATEDNFEGASQAKINSFIGENTKNLENVSRDILEKYGQDVDIDSLVDDIKQGLPTPVDLTAQVAEFDRLNNKLNELKTASGGETLAPLQDGDRRGLELNTLLNTVQDVDERIGLTELDESTSENIIDLFEKEIIAEGLAESQGGTYTNVEPLVILQNSLQKRIAQIQNIIDLQGFPTVPKLTEIEGRALINNAGEMLGEVAKLQNIAADNLNNPEEAINDNALNLLNYKISDIINIGNKLGENSNFAELHAIVGTHLGNLTEAHENSDIPTLLKVLHVFESDLYNAVKNNPAISIQDVLSQLNPLVKDNSEDAKTYIDEQEYIVYKRNHDYLSGVLTVNSQNLYSAYHSVISESNQENMSPSIEQRIIIQDAVRGAMNSGYNPEFPWDLGVPGIKADAAGMKLTDTVYIDGAGGTGKTAIVMVITAATIIKLNGDGKAFFTSEEGGNRIKNINQQAIDFEGIPIKTDGSTFTIGSLLADTKNLDDVSVIVFDEATLLSTQQFREYANIINKYNAGKTEGRVKIIYGGDSAQVNIGTTETNNRAGVNNKLKMLLPRTDRLDYSFRSQNQDLKVMGSVLYSHQSGIGIPKRNIVLNNSGNEGVKIIHDKETFDKEVLKFVKNLSDGQSQKTVYITTDISNINVDIANAGINILTAQQAQGQEWTNVIVDFNDPLYKDGSYNHKVKQEYYTAITRPSKFLLMSLPKGQQMSSKKGKVYEINPERLENDTKENEAIAIEEITDGIDNTVQQVITESITPTPSIENTDPGSQENTLTPLTDVKLDDITKFEQQLSNFFKNFKEGSLKLHTFFTTADSTQSLNKVFDLKRKLIYGDENVNKNYGYRLVLAQIGSAEYENVVRNDPKFNGNYAIFLEGFNKNPTADDVASTIIGVLGGSNLAPGFNDELTKLIADNNIFRDGSTVKSMEVSKSIFSNDKIAGGFIQGDTQVSIPELIKNSPGINFGNVKIFATKVINAKGIRAARAGQAFIPASFSLTTDEINSKLNAFEGDGNKLIQDKDIIPIYVDGTNNSVETIYNELEQMLEEYPTGINGSIERLFPRKQNANGKYYLPKGVFAYSTPLGAAYGALIARHSISGKFSRESNLNRAIQSVYEANTDGIDTEYSKFLKKWADAAVEDNNIRNQYTQQEIKVRDKDSSRTYFLFRDYVEAKANNRSDVVHYEKLLNEIQAIKIPASRTSISGETTVSEIPLFKDGFEYSFIADKKSGAGALLSSIGGDSELTYKNSRTAKANNVSQPSLNLSTAGLVGGLLATSPINIPTPSIPNNNISDSNIEQDDITTNGALQQPTQDVDMSGDGEKDTYVDPMDVKIFDDEGFDYNKGTVLDDFQKLYYAGSNVNRMQRGIDQFKRNVWKSIFRTTGNAEMADISTAIAEFRTRVDSIKIQGDNNNQALVTDANEHYWHDAVASSAFDFLMKTYFPTFKTTFKDGKITYVARVTSYKQATYDDVGKSLLDNTANEMVKTILFNTEELYKKDNKIYSKGVFLDRNDIEDALDIFKDNLTHNEIVAAMKAHVSNENGAEVNSVILSLYHQYYATQPYQLGGKGEQNYSLAAITNSDTPIKMVEALTAFMRTGSVYKYVHVDVNGTSASIKGRPNPSGNKPNLLRQILLDSVIENSTELTNRLSEDTTKNIISLSTRTGEIIDIPADGSIDEIKLLTVFKEMGIPRFNSNVIAELKRSRDENPETINLNLTNIAYDILNKTLIGGNFNVEAKPEFFESILTSKFNSYVAMPIAKNDGILTELSYINLNGDKVNRLRDRTPINSVNLIIDKIRAAENSIYSDNLFVNNTFEIQDIVNKDGFKYFNQGFTKAKNHKNFLESEEAEYDILWGFFNTIKSLKPTSNLFSYAMFSPLVYSDSSSDLMPMVKLTKEQISNPESTLESLYNSRKASYSKIQELVKLKKYPISGMNDNPVFNENVARYINGSYADFEKYVNGRLKELIDKIPLNIKDEMSSGIEEFGLSNAEAVIKSFYYNWLAVSGEFGDITIGKLDNFNGKNHSDKYIDFTKRAKMQTSTRSGMVFRNNNWSEELAKFRLENPNTPLPERMVQEGMKLAKSGKVAYVDDVVVNLTTLDMSRVDGKQEVLDGATFTNPLTKIFQRASSGGDFGTKIATVSKPITNMLDPVTGVGVGIKNAEFELSAEILRNGTSIVHNMMNNMLTDKIHDMLVDIALNNYGKDLLAANNEAIKELGENPTTEAVDAIAIELAESTKADIEANVSSVYDIVTQKDFVELARQVVEQGLQDDIIHEIIPKSSRKYGKTAFNPINAEKYSTDEMDFTNKGQQLDASHNVTERNDLTIISQYLSSITTNYKNPEHITRVYAAISELAISEIDNWSGDIKAKGKLNTLVKNAINKRVGVSYQHSLVNQDEFSFNDKQIYKTVHSQLNSELTNNGIRIKLFGGQYILHPQSSIISLSRDTEGRVYLKNEVPEGVEILESNKNIDLGWASPIHESGKKLEEFEPYIKLRAKYIKEGNTGKKALRAFQNEVDNMLSTSEWSPGFGEMLIPIALGKQFNLTQDDLNIPIDDYNAEFFTNKLLTNPKNKLTVEQATERGNAQAEDFQKSLLMLNVRIPTTGKHSGVVLKAVGFINSSDNSVFVPPMLLYVQGADHDIDKGNLTGLKAIDGIIPLLDDNLEPDARTKQWFPKLTPGQRKVALVNTISSGLMDISASPTNAVEGNSAVDSLLKDMKALLKPSDKPVHHKDSYLSFIKLRQDNQAGKALVGAFANAQKAYLTLDGFGSLNNQDMGLPAKDGLDRTSEVFAALINAATDNAKVQILGPLGINITNAGMVGFMVMKGMDLPQIVKVLQDNTGDFNKIREASHYTSSPFDDKVLSADMKILYRGGKELSLISKSILNTKLPNSPYEAFNYNYKISAAVSTVLGKPFNFNDFINGTPENATNLIADYESKIAEGKANFNILSILNPYVGKHSSNAYVQLYKKSQEVVQNQIPIVNLINKIAYQHGVKAKKNSLQDTTYDSIANYTYGIAISDFFSSNKFLNNKGIVENLIEEDTDLSTAEGRSRWVSYFNSTIMPEMKNKYKGEDENIFIDSLRPIPIEKYGYPKHSVTYGLPDLRNVDASKILMYSVAFNNDALLDVADRTKLLVYSLITTGGKAGKGSFAQIFKYDEPMVQAFNAHLDKFVNFDFDIESLVTGFNISESNNRINGAELLPNALPYNSIISPEIEEDKSILTLSRTNSTDSILSGEATAMALTDKQLSNNITLSQAARLLGNQGTVSKRMVIKNNKSSGEAVVTYHGKSEVDIPSDKFLKGYPKKSNTHIFTIDVVGFVKMDRFNASKPSTYSFTDKGDVSRTHRKSIMQHVNALISEGNIDKGRIYLEDFGINGGLLYNQIRLRLNSKIPNLNQYYLGFGDFAKTVLKESAQEGSIKTVSQVKEEIFELITSRDLTKPLTTGQRNELINNLQTYKSQDEVDFYLTKLYTGVSKLSSKDENLILTKAKAWYANNRVELKNSSKGQSIKDAAKKKGELKGNARARIKMSQIGGLIRSYENVDITNKVVIERVMSRLTANIRSSDATKVGRKLKKLGVDVPVINSFLGTKFKVKDEDNIRAVKRIDTLINKDDVFRFSNIISGFGYDIETDGEISFLDTTKNTGESILDILEIVSKDNSFDEADKYFAERLLNQYESTRRYMTDNQINDISRVCGK